MTTAPLSPATVRAVAVPANRPTGGGAGTVVLDPVRIFKQYKFVLAIAVVLGAVVGFGAYLVLRQVAPEYQATVLYEALPPTSSIREEAIAQNREELERYILTQVFLMTSDRVLREAIKSGDVAKTNWAQQFLDPSGRILESDALRAVKKMASSRPRTGTYILQLTVNTPIAADAAVLANSIHSAYFADLGSSGTAASIERLEPLSRTKGQLVQNVQNSDASMRRIMAQFKIEDNGGIGSSESVEIGQLQPRIVELVARVESLKVRVSRLRAAASGEGGVIQYNDDQRETADRDPLVLNARQRINDYSINDASLRDRGLLETHPDRVRNRSFWEAAKVELGRTREEVLRKLYDSELEQSQQALKSSESEKLELDRKLEIAKNRRAETAQAQIDLAALRDQRAISVTELASVQRALDSIQEIDQLRKAERVGRMRRIQNAQTPDQLFFPRWQTLIPTGVVLLSGLTLGLVVLRELLDHRVRTPSDITAIPRLKLIGIIPILSEDPTRPATVETAFRDAPTGAISEAFRQIRGPVLKRMQNAGYKTLLVISGSPQSGATTTVANLAMGAAASDLRVLMIDGNLRRPGLHKVFKLAEGPGLGDLLAKKVDFAAAVQQTSTSNLHLLAAGTASTRNLPERLSSESMSHLLAEAREKYDFIFIDSAPALIAGDGIALANRCDASILVVKAYSEKRGLIARVRDQLTDSKAEFFGVVVNAVRHSAGGYLKKNIKAAYDYQTTTS